MTGYANARIHAETLWDEVDQPWGNLAELIPNASEHVDLAATHDYSLVRHQPRLHTIEIHCLGTKLHGHEALRACHRDSRTFLPRPPLPYLAEPCVWLGCSNRRSSVLRGSEQSALAAKTDNTPTTVVCVPLWNEGNSCLTTDCKMSIKTTGKNCYSLTATTKPPKHKSEVRCVACNYLPPAPLALRAHLPCTAALGPAT